MKKVGQKRISNGVKNQKGFISIILTIVITAVLIGGGTYYWQQQIATKQINQVASDITTQAESNINNLQAQLDALQAQVEEEVEEEVIGGFTYVNEEHGFKFNYQGLGAEEVDIDVWELTTTAPDDEGDYHWLIVGNQKKLYLLSKKNGYVNRQSCLTDYNDYILDVLESEISYCNIVKNDTVYGIMYDVNNMHHLSLVFDQFTVHASVSYSEYKEIFDDIIKSFKFLEDTSDWQTYINYNRAFSFKYPAEWSYLYADDILGGQGYNVVAGESEPVDGEITVPSFYFSINRDGAGPYFPNKRIKLGVKDRKFFIVDEEVVDPTGGQNPETYFIIASNDPVEEDPRFWMSFRVDSDNKDEADGIIRDIINSFEL
ncbi:hypothetical protein K8R42_01945 [bacterium]|nr:hypothetical protein [bacterium]